MKTCTGPCKKNMPLSDFHKNHTRKDGREGVCKTCKNKQRSRLRKKREDELQEDPYFVWREQIFAPELVTWEQELKIIADLGIDITKVTAGEVDNILEGLNYEH